MKSFALVSLMALTAACAEKKYHDRDMNNPSYHEGSGIAVTDNASVGGIYQSPNIAPSAYTSQDAALGLIESGISLAAYPDYYKASTISGTCVIGDLDLSQVPCRHVMVELVDQSDQVIGTAACNDSGQFAFYVKKNKSYRLRLAGSRYVINDKDGLQTLEMGAKVIIHAIRPSK